jgi:hypothetical protein
MRLRTFTAIEGLASGTADILSTGHGRPRLRQPACLSGWSLSTLTKALSASAECDDAVFSQDAGWRRTENILRGAWLHFTPTGYLLGCRSADIRAAVALCLAEADGGNCGRNLFSSPRRGFSRRRAAGREGRSCSRIGSSWSLQESSRESAGDFHCRPGSCNVAGGIFPACKGPGAGARCKTASRRGIRRRIERAYPKCRSW